MRMKQKVKMNTPSMEGQNELEARNTVLEDICEELRSKIRELERDLEQKDDRIKELEGALGDVQSLVQSTL